MRRAAGIAFLLFVGLSVVVVAGYLVLLLEFDMPLAPPLVLMGLVVLSFGAVLRLSSRRR